MTRRSQSEVVPFIGMTLRAMRITKSSQSNILTLGNDLKMGRVDAQSVPTHVIHNHPFRDRTNKDFVEQSMSRNVNSIASGLPIAPTIHIT